jgi:hypothetical protein
VRSLNDSTNANPLSLFSATNPPLNYGVASRAPDAYNGKNVSFADYHTPVARIFQWSVGIEKQLPGGSLRTNWRRRLIRKASVPALNSCISAAIYYNAISNC